MRRIVIFLSALLFISSSFVSFFSVRDASAWIESSHFTSPFLTRNEPAGIESSLTVSPGIRVDNLDWNIANTDGSPNILSELTWTDLMIIQIKTSGKLVIADKFYLRSSFDYGEIFDGKNQDSDYLLNNRRGEFSRSNNSTDDGNVMDASVGLGYQETAKNVVVAILIGYSYHEQNLVMTNGYQTLDPLGIVGGTGPLPGLNSKYDTQWRGPWAGIDFTITLIEKLTLSGLFEYHWADYKAVADWNLREDFKHPKSFEQLADGYGIFIAAAINYAFNHHWSISATADYQDWWTNSGTDRTFFSNGAEIKTRLNEVNWDSIMAGMGITYSF